MCSPSQSIDLFLRCFYFQPNMICKNTLGLSLHCYLFTFDEARFTPGSCQIKLDMTHWSVTWIPRAVSWKKCTQNSNHCNPPQIKKENSHLFHFSFLNMIYKEMLSHGYQLEKNTTRELQSRKGYFDLQGESRLDSIDQNYCAHSGFCPRIRADQNLYICNQQQLFSN